MKIKRIPAGVYAANCYILMDEATKEAVVMDPGGDADDLIKAIEGIQANVKYILLTHGHADHTGAVIELKNKYKVPVYLHKADYDMIENDEFIYGKISGYVDKFIEEGDIIKLSGGEIKCIHTPGHTPGGVSFLIKNMLFTGDTLFTGSIGRTDFAGGDFDTIIRSIKDKLMALPENTEVFPGHGPESTIGNEKVHNPFL